MLLPSCILASVLCLPTAFAFKHHNRTGNHTHFHSSENIILNHQSVNEPSQPVPLGILQLSQKSITANTSTVTSVKTPIAQAAASAKVDSTVLVIARDATSAYSAYSGLNDRGIPYSVLVVPQAGATLPSLNDTTTHGNYGLIVVLSEVSYNYGTKGFASALTAAQWASLYSYQISFGVRMVRLDVAPSADTGTQSLGACCTGEQLISISNASSFLQAGLNVGAGLTTKGLYHYPAKITNPKIAWEIAQFAAAPADNITTTSTAAVINVIDGRQQMVFFLPFSTDWSLTSNFLQHAWITWGTRGLFAGWRRAMLNTQVDDMFLETPMFDTGENFRCSAADVAHHVTVMTGINKRLNPGSNWWIEIGHNGNGNIEKADTSGSDTVCKPGPIEYADQIDTPLEFAKPLGSGTSIWPATSSVDYGNYTLACMKKDPLFVWWQTPANLNAFSHISHTFSHEDQDNSTYFDVVREITWNKAWLDQSGISKATKFSSTGIIPPAITGMHNGDALKAWFEQGIVHVVGDNTRKPLLNADNEHWPLMSTVAANGYAGIQITPRWASNIYYNCNYADCVVAEWKNVSKGVGDMYTILGIEQETNTRHLLGLHHDPFMFHQANLMYEDADFYTMSDDVTTVYSLMEVWVEMVIREFTRLVNWPLVTLKHDDINASFKDRMTRDACKYKLTWDVNPTAGTITAVTVTATRNTCSVPIPITVPGLVTDPQGFTTEKLGNDPWTIWVKLTGSPVTFNLTTPVTV